MRYAALVMFDTEDLPEDIVNEIRCNLEFDHQTTVLAVSVHTDDGEEVAKFDNKEQK